MTVLPSPKFLLRRHMQLRASTSFLMGRFHAKVISPFQHPKHMHTRTHGSVTKGGTQGCVFGEHLSLVARCARDEKKVAFFWPKFQHIATIFNPNSCRIWLSCLTQLNSPENFKVKVHNFDLKRYFKAV